ncbi:MAG TPA: peptidoglycan recognition family protein [Kofleriaceae bacterium]|nr:peptidoglycan recognition family protein [Kofleriaceae bacterium]
MLAAILATAPAHADPVIVDKPISWSPERERLTLEYRRAHQDPAAADTAITPRVIVLHHTGGRSPDATWRYFDRTRLEAARAKLRRGGEVNVSAHFLVARDGTIYRLQPETRMARHCIGLNHIAIGIENVGGAPGVPLTAAQVDANAALVRALAMRYPITHLIGHHESRAMEGHRYWRERDPAYRNRKPDPGAEFLGRVRMRVFDLFLSGPPR